jgi:hypothetical protein
MILNYAAICASIAPLSSQSSDLDDPYAVASRPFFASIRLLANARREEMRVSKYCEAITSAIVSRGLREWICAARYDDKRLRRLTL